MKDFYSIITQKGLESLVSAKISGESINLTKIVVGDGNGAYYSPDSNQSKLANELYRGDLNRIYVDANYPNQLIIEAGIPETIGDFFIREIGILDEKDNLFAIGKYPVTFKPLSDSGSGKDLYIRMALTFSSTPNVILYINPHSALVSADQLENFANKDLSNVADDLKNHQNWLNLQGGISTERYHLNKLEYDAAVSLQSLINEENQNKEIVINSIGNGLTVVPSKEILQNIVIVEDNNIELTELCSIYKKIVDIETTLTIDATKAAKYGKVITFEVWLVLTTICDVNFPEATKWLGGEKPEYDEATNYLIALRSFDNGLTWVGCLQGKWYETQN